MYRECQDALIPEQFCRCHIPESVTESQFETLAHVSFQLAIDFMLVQINNYTEPVRSLCSLFSFDQLVAIKKLTINSANLFAVSARLQPGDSVFEFILKSVNKRLVLVGKPIRLSLYGSQSHCIPTDTYLGYCFCIDNY